MVSKIDITNTNEYYSLEQVIKFNINVWENVVGKIASVAIVVFITICVPFLFTSGATAASNNSSKSPQELRQACDADDAKSCYEIGVRHYKELGVERDPKKAASYYEKSCDGGYVDACKELSRMYFGGLGVQKNRRKAVSYFEKACDNGDVQSCNFAAYRYLYGRSVLRDSEKAMALYGKACEMSDANACEKLGSHYEKGTHTKSDIDKAIASYRQACDLKSKSACENLSRIEASNRKFNRDDVIKDAKLLQTLLKRYHPNLYAHRKSRALEKIWKSALQELGHPMRTIVVPEGTAKSNGHHFDHPDPERVIRFISRHASAHRKPEHLLKNARRIVFLGDSITYAGHYVTYFSSWLEEQATPSRPVVINVGLPSETVSGLSEDGHAGGRFPRPHLDERLERVLRETKPDLVIACYGINCGIYQPFDPQRLRAYKQGLIGLRNAVQNAEADIVFVTPPTFDDQKSNKPFSYDDVMDKYAKHLLNAGHGSTENWSVIDLHGPMKQELLRRRASDPEFTFQPDAVHPNKSGHWFIAQQLIGSFGGDKEFADTPEQEFDSDTLRLVEKRMTLLRDAYLSAAGHKRPGIRKGMPLRAAKAAAAEITQQLRSATSPAAN